MRPPSRGLRRRDTLRRIERACWILGALLALTWIGFRVSGKLSADAEVRRFEQALARTPPVAAPRPAGPAAGAPPPLPADAPRGTLPVPEADLALWSESRVQHYRETLAEPVGVPLALLSVPAIDLRVAVLEGTGALVLNRGVGRIRGTAGVDESGNIGIAGHRDGFFRGLKDVAVGDTIEWTTLGGTREYVITELTIVAPEDVSVLAPTPGPALTLVTCYPFYHIGKAPERFIVRALPRPAADRAATSGPR